MLSCRVASAADRAFSPLKTLRGRRRGRAQWCVRGAAERRVNHALPPRRERGASVLERPCPTVRGESVRAPHCAYRQDTSAIRGDCLTAIANRRGERRRKAGVATGRGVRRGPSHRSAADSHASTRGDATRPRCVTKLSRRECPSSELPAACPCAPCRSAALVRWSPARTRTFRQGRARGAFVSHASTPRRRRARAVPRSGPPCPGAAAATDSLCRISLVALRIYRAGRHSSQSSYGIFMTPVRP